MSPEEDDMTNHEYAPEHVNVWVKRRRPKAAVSDGI